MTIALRDEVRIGIFCKSGVCYTHISNINFLKIIKYILKLNQHDPNANDDAQLWISFKSGDHASFEKIYTMHFDGLAQYGKSITKDEASIADSIQELFIELWNKRESIGLTDNIRAYLLVSFRRKLIKKLGNQSISIEDKHLNINDYSAEDQIVAQERTNEQVHLLHYGINELSKKQKEIIHLKFFQELEYEEISKIMDINYQSCRNLVSGALKKLELSIKMKKSQFK